MNEQMIKRIMTGLILTGLILIGIGIYLIIFTDIAISNGTNGIFTIAGLIAGGLFVSVPAKIYLTLQLMKQNDEMLKARNQTNKLTNPHQDN